MSRYRHAGLEREPFAPEPDLAFQAPALGQADAAARLTDFVAARAGLGLVTGEAGLGKSLLRLALTRDLAVIPQLRIFTLDHPDEWSTDVTFLRAAATTLGATAGGRTTFDLLSEIGEQLTAIIADDLWPLLLIDDADRLTSSQLELVRTIIAVEPARLTLLLFGEPELEERIARRRSLAGRIGLRHTLNPLNPADAAGLLDFRLRVAGLPPGERLFADDARALLIESARGNPGRLIELAAKALDVAARRQVLPIERAHVISARGEGEEPATLHQIELGLTGLGRDGRR